MLCLYYSLPSPPCCKPNVNSNTPCYFRILGNRREPLDALEAIVDFQFFNGCFSWEEALLETLDLYYDYDTAKKSKETACSPEYFRTLEF